MGTIIHQARHVLRVYRPPVWWQVTGEDPCWRQIALGFWHRDLSRRMAPSHMQVQPLSVRAHFQLTDVGLGCCGREKSSELNPCSGLYSNPGWSRFNVSRPGASKGADLSPVAKAVPGWRALTRATGHNKSRWQLLCTSGAIGSAIDSVCLGLGFASLIRPVDSSVQARDFTVRAHSAGGPQPRHSCRLDTRDL